MALKYGTTTITASHTIKYGTTALKELKYGSTSVWKKSVNVTNVIGANSNYRLTLTRALDIGYTNSYTNVWYRSATNDSVARTYSLTSGHRYYVRASCSKFGSFTAGGTNQVYFSDSSRHLVADNTTGHTIIAVNQASCKPEQYTTGSTSAGASAGTSSEFLMIVDITNLEAAAGTTLTAAQVWSYFGSAVFYGSKEVSL